ncbi:SemiSWEET transporter [Flavobacteriaceae bacterium]|nr:SemiSWEET transporter [Flavobacteriaceae bacterium]
MIDKNELIGFIAAVCTTFAFLPQVIKVWKTKQTKDLSLRMYTIMFIGICLWFVYGLRIKSLSIIFSNIVTGVLVFTIVVYIFKNKE